MERETTVLAKLFTIAALSVCLISCDAPNYPQYTAGQVVRVKLNGRCAAINYDSGMNWVTIRMRTMDEHEVDKGEIVPDPKCVSK